MTNAPQTSTDSRLLTRLREVDERPGLLVVTGLVASEIGQFTSSLSKELSGANIHTLVFDPHSGATQEQTLHGVVASLVAVANAAGGMTEDAISSLETYEAVRRPAGSVPEASQGRLRHEVLGDLLSSLSASTPFVILCSNLADSSAGDRAAVAYLASNVFADPIRNLAPELHSERRVHGAIVVLGDPGRLEGAEVFDFGDDATTKIRAFLSTDETIERIAEAIGGDLSRLAQIVEQLPESARNFQWARFKTMDDQVRDIVEFFAVAGTPLSSEVAKRALGLLERSEFFGRAVKDALSEGFLRRSVSAGEVKIWVEDAALAEHIIEVVASETFREIHRALANAERLNPDTPDSNFIARHFLKANDLDAAQEYVLHACQRFANRGAWDEALSLLDVASRKLADPSPLLEIRLEALTATGRFRDALAVADQLDIAEPARPAFDLRVGRLLLQLSEFDAARARFESAVSGDIDIQQGAELGLAECDYALGKLPAADDRLGQLLHALDGSVGARAELDRLRILAQNLRGRIAIFQARYDEASEIFEANRVLAAQWAWEDEVARADANLGVVAMQLRDHAEALSRLQTALKSHGMRGARPRAYGLVNLATIYQRLDEHHNALEACLEGLRCARRSGDDVAYGVAAHNLATIYQDMGAFERGHAIIDHLHAAPEHRTMVSRWSRLVQGYLYFDEQRFSDAKTVFEELAEGDQLLYQAEARLRLAQCHVSLGQLPSAKELLDERAERKPDGDEPLLEALVWLLEAELRSDKPEEALDLSLRALARFRELSQRTDTVHAACLVASSLTALGRDGEARGVLETEMQEIVRRATYVPDEFQSAFFAKPVHRQLVAELQRLRGDVPSEVREHLTPAVSAEVHPVRLEAWNQRYANMVGESARLHQVFRLIDRVAKSDATVLVYGESGTGKELIAEALHHNSDRSRGPFVKVNCAAFVENLLLSELFGHEKGAFTGASSQKPGRFELADGGTIFLDEIGDVSPNTQVALLRVLQEGTFERVGGSTTQHVNVRVVCATNRNLEEMVQRGEFRLDLYYRLKGVVIESPALRERREDIPRLLEYFAHKFADGTPKQFSHVVMKHLMRYSWPGNIRELQNFVRSILLFVEGHEVTMGDLDDFRDFFISGEFQDVSVELPELTPRPAIVPAATTLTISGRDPEDVLVDKIVNQGMCLNELKKRLEVEAIKRALLEADGNVTKAAEMLQMKRPRLSQIINGTEELADLKALLVG